MKGARFLVVAVIAACFARHATAQSTYVDLDINDGDAGIGNGAPGPTFGGAAGVSGFWNRVPITDYGPLRLSDTGGSQSTAVLTWTGSGGGIGFRNTSNSGDYALLLNDAERVGAGPLVFTISGLRLGSYRVFTYAVKPQGDPATTNITVTGSNGSTQQVASGAMPGNQFIQGITHTVNDVDLTGGPLTIQAWGQWPNSYVNGFQIVAVPEPASALACLLGLGSFVMRRRKGK